MQSELLAPELFYVTGKRRESDDSVTLEILPEQALASRPEPGQFNMLYAFGIGEAPISLAGYSVQEEGLLHTIRAVGKVTEALCALEPGDCLGVRGPFGSSWPKARLESHHVLLVAGGIGLAPLRPVLEQLSQKRDAKLITTLLYGVRKPQDLLYEDRLAVWKEAFDGQLYSTVDFADETWNGRVGAVPGLLPEVSVVWEEAIALICGPEIMMRFTAEALLARGMAPENIFISMERNMACAVGHCGRCQFMGDFVCKDGPVFSYAHVKRFFAKQEL